MDSFRRRRHASLERRLRAAAPTPRAEFVDETLRLIASRPDLRPSRLRIVLAVGFAAALASSFVALGATSYVKAAAAAVASTAKSTIAATTQGGGHGRGKAKGNDDNGNNGNGNNGNNGNGDNGNGNGDNDSNAGGNDHCNDGHGNDCGGGSGSAQYGHGTAICHRTHSEKNPFVLIVVPQSALPAHQAHGDIIPAPADGCPGGSKKGKKTKPHVKPSKSQLAVGDDANFEISVDAEDGSSARGAVTCFDNEVEFDSVAVFDGSAACSEFVDVAGVHTITAVYSTADSDQWASSESDAVAVTVDPVAASVALTTSGTPSDPGSPVTLTAAVTASDGEPPTPSGAVQFLDGLEPLGAPVPLSASGVATLTTAALHSGSHTITAAYSGDDVYAIASGTLTQQVLAAASTATLAASPNPSAAGQPVTLTVTLAAADGSAPQGTVQILDGTTPAGSATADGAATVDVTAAFTGAGTHSLTAVYTSSDTSKWAGSTSAALSQVVQKTSTAVTLASSANPAFAGSAVTLTATVTPAQQYTALGGTVEFFDGTTSLGSGAVGGAGTATATTSALAPGAHSLTARYGGDAAYTAASSGALSQTVQAATTSLSYTGAVTGVRGRPLSLSAGITGAPVGSPVVFTYPGGSTAGTAGTPVSITPSWTGPATVNVSYAGDASHLPSATPAVVTVSVATSLTLSSSPAASTVGQNVTLTATLTASGASLPAGAAVAFSDGGTSLGTVTVDGVGKASIGVSTLAAGTHAIAASYAGSTAAYVLGSTATLTQTVSKVATSIVYTGPTTVTQGQPATFTASLVGVADGSAITFTFPGGGTAVGTATGNAASVTTTPLWSPLSGTTVTVSYAGDAARASSTTIAAVTILEKQAATTAALAVSPNPVPSGSTVSFTATVTAGDGTIPSGTVSFYDNSFTPFATVAVDSAGRATAAAPAGSVGTHLVAVVFTATDTKRYANATSGILSLNVTKPTVTLALSSSSNPVVPGGSVTFTATVTPSTLAGATPSGTVVFLDGTTTLGTVTLSNGTATLTRAFSTAGLHSISATYSGDATYAGGAGDSLSQSIAAASTTAAYTGSTGALYGQPLALSAAVPGAPDGASVTITYPGGSTSLVLGTTVTLTPTWIGPGTVKVAYAGDATHLASAATATVTSSVPTALTLSSSLNPAPIDAPVTLSATIATPSGTSLPSGSAVTFFDGATSLGTATVVAGQASLTVGTFAAGTHSLSVSFAGNPGLYVMPGSSSLSETVIGLPTTVSYTGPPNTYGGVPITLTAATTGIADGGVITFTLPGGATVSGTVRSNSASATTTVNWTPVNGSTVGVSYAGDARRAAATATGTLVLFTRAVGIGVSSSANPVPSGQSLTYTVSVSSNEVANPQGSVTVYDDGSSLGTRTLSPSGTASVTVTAGTVGAHSITTSYASSDTGKWVNGTSSALSQTIGKPAVTVSLGSSNASVEPGTQVTLTATVLPVVRVTVAPTGTVQFKEGSTVLGTGTISSSGVAAFSTSALAIGTHSITAVYSGDSLYDGNTSGALAQTVSQTPTLTALTVSTTTPSTTQFVLVGVTVTSRGAALGGGTMTFVLDGVTLATVPVSDGGQSGYVLYRLAAGTHTLAAQYTPASGSYAGSSESLTLTAK